MSLIAFLPIEGAIVRNLKKMVLIAGATIVLCGTLLLGWIHLTWSRDYDDVPPPELRASTDPEIIARFRAGRVVPESIMPWGPFSRMSDQDLRAIYLYLNSLDPHVNPVAPIVERIAP